MEMFKKGIRDGIPIALGYIAVSFTFGITAVTGGLRVWQAVLISFMCVTSAGQFAGIEIMMAMGGMVEMALTQLVINLRYSLMSISLSQKADESMDTLARFLVGFGVTDEIFGVAVGSNESVNKKYMYGLILVPWLSWTFGTFGGAVLGSVLPKTLSEAFGIAIYGMFLAIIIPAGRDHGNVMKVVIIAVLFSCLIYYTPFKRHISQGFTIILTSVAASAIGAVLYPVGEDEEEKKTE